MESLEIKILNLNEFAGENKNLNFKDISPYLKGAGFKKEDLVIFVPTYGHGEIIESILLAQEKLPERWRILADYDDKDNLLRSSPVWIFFSRENLDDVDNFLSNYSSKRKIKYIKKID